MYINFWYPICRSDELAESGPLRSKLLGMQYVAFRDSNGDPHVLSDTCVHRGGSLSKGKVIGDSLACPYHGWQYGGDGKCTLVPSQSDNKKTPATFTLFLSDTFQGRFLVIFSKVVNVLRLDEPPLCIVTVDLI